jgi:hypothetical protein
MASGPLADLLAVAMVGVACFHASRLASALLLRRSTEVDVDIVHTVMGVSMAGMLTGWLTGAWNVAWMVIFAASSFWFGLGAVRQLSDPEPVSAVATHHLPHFVASAVMLYMLVAMRWSMANPNMSSMGHVSGSVLPPAILTALVMGNAAITAWRTLLLAPQRAVVPEVVPSATSGAGGASVRPVVPLQRPVVPLQRPVGALAPRGTAACLLVMSLAMGYMLITVRP